MELGVLQQFARARSEITKSQRSTVRFCAGIGSDLRSEIRAIDPRDNFNVQDDLLLVLAEQALHFFAERAGFLSKHNTSIQRQHGHVAAEQLFRERPDLLLPLLANRARFCARGDLRLTQRYSGALVEVAIHNMI